jgi:hypothetical protein
MANVFSVNVYQINQTNVLPRDAPQRIGFPSTGVLIRSCIDSPTRSLSSGYNVYGVIQLLATGDQYYTAETQAQLITLSNA